MRQDYALSEILAALHRLEVHFLGHCPAPDMEALTDRWCRDLHRIRRPAGHEAGAIASALSQVFKK